MRIFALCTVLISGLSLDCLNGNVVAGEQTTDSSKEKVAGIGGVFFKAKDPKMLAKWYEENLGVKQTPTSYDESPWVQVAGPTVFAPFNEKTQYFGKASQRWMINFRVNNLKKMVAQLEKAGIKVEVDSKEYPNGFFARLYDPEGNPIELWQPK